MKGAIMGSVEQRRTMRSMSLTIVAALLVALPAASQEISRNKGLTVERAERTPPNDRRVAVQTLPALQQPPCDGANHTTNDFNDSWLMGGPIVGIAWVPAATETITRIEVFTGETTGPIALAIWSDDGGSPSRPLANLGDTGYFNISTTNGWQGKNLTSPVTVIGGAKYWIVFDPQGGEQAPIQNGTGQQYWGSYTGTISSVAPGDWFGPFSSNDHAWKFRVYCLPPPKDVYAVKFLCGNFMPRTTSPPTEGAEWPVKPGNYFTAINVHNPSSDSVRFQKKAVMLYRADKPPEPEQPMPPGRLHDASLRGDWGLEIDCADIRQKLLGDVAPQSPTFIKGWVVIEVTGAPDMAPMPIDVTAVYTGHGWDLSTGRPVYVGFAEDVESVHPTRIKR